MLIAVTPEDFAFAHPINLDRIAPVLVQADTDGGRHLVFDDPDGRHRVSILDARHENRGAFLIPFDRDASVRLHATQRLYRRLSGQRAGPPLRSMQLSPSQRMRLALQIRALDAVGDGATRREIAAVLLDPDARTIPAIEWKTSALRKRVNRLITAAQAHMNGGYLTLLRADSRRSARFGRTINEL